jgi:Zn-dependent M16 (insulinase) family peptidase
MSFEHIRSEAIPTLNLTLEEYRHQITGARHLHLSADDEQNVFVVAFLTVPMDSSGVAHILEHTSLCGSQRYPVRDPFFMMTRRSLNTFMNALTSSDWTAYPFASQNRKDFENLMRVYLDAAFFPNLNELDFAQEGHRLEFETPNDPNSPLVYKGVVFNEMKGAMSSPVRKLVRDLYALLYPTSTYHYNSGGEPEDMPNLTWQQLKDFHATHYHPSNSVFLTYGNIPAAEHQAMFHDCALQYFDAPGKRLSVSDEQRYTTPVTGETVYALDGEAETQGKTHIVLSWLLGASTDQRVLMDTLLLNGILLDSSASPLLHALETSDLGSAPGPLCGIDSHSREMMFACGLEGSDPEHAEAVEKLVFDVLEDVAENGVPLAHVEAILHQIELQQREITGDHFPYGLNLLLNALGKVLHGGDPAQGLNIDAHLEALRQDIQDPAFVKNLVRRNLLDNPHRVRLVMKPDTELSERQAEAEKQRLADLQASLSDADKNAIIERAQALEERQAQEDDPELLPKVTLADVPEDLHFAEGQDAKVDGTDVPLTYFSQGTNGMVYQQLIVDLPALDEELIDFIPLLCECFTDVGVGDLDYRATQAWQTAVTGSLSANSQIRGSVADVQQARSVFVLAGKALARNQSGLSDILAQSFLQPRFDELERLQDVIAQVRGDMESSITGRGTQLAMSAASSHLCPTGFAAHRWHGLYAIRNIKALDEALKSPAALQDFAAKLARLHEKLLSAPRQFLLISEAEHRAAFEDSLAKAWANAPLPQQGEAFQLAFQPTQIKQGWRASTQVNFCAKVYPTVPYTHEDSAVLLVLGDFLRNGFLHRAIREQGGAYGGGAGYNQDTGSFRFYSYRDPRLKDTLEDFDRAIDWLLSSKHDERVLEEAVLGLISNIDRPASPAGEAKGAFYGALHGRTPELRRDFRRRVLHVGLDDLKRAAERWLIPDKAHVAVVSNSKNLDASGVELELENV